MSVLPILLFVLYFFMGHPRVYAVSNRFGIECSPAVSLNRVYVTQEPVVGSKGAGLGMSFMASYYFPIQERCSVSTGFCYTIGHIGVMRNSPTMLDDTSDASIAAVDEKHTIHYVGIPCLLRCHTNELRIDTNLYFKVGSILSMRLFTRPIHALKNKIVPFIDKTNLFDLFLLLGTGVKYDFGLNSSLTLGLSFCLDLFGVVHKQDQLSGKVYIHNHFICLDIGLLF